MRCPLLLIFDVLVRSYYQTYLRLIVWHRIKHRVNKNVPFPTIDQEGIRIQRLLSDPGQEQMLTTTEETFGDQTIRSARKDRYAQ